MAGQEAWRGHSPPGRGVGVGGPERRGPALPRPCSPLPPRSAPEPSGLISLVRVFLVITSSSVLECFLPTVEMMPKFSHSHPGQGAGPRQGTTRGRSGLGLPVGPTHRQAIKPRGTGHPGRLPRKTSPDELRKENHHQRPRPLPLRATLKRLHGLYLLASRCPAGILSRGHTLRTHGCPFQRHSCQLEKGGTPNAQ